MENYSRGYLTDLYKVNKKEFLKIANEAYEKDKPYYDNVIFPIMADEQKLVDSEKVPQGYVRCPFCLKNTKRIVKNRSDALVVILVMATLFFGFLAFLSLEKSNAISFLIITMPLGVCFLASLILLLIFGNQKLIFCEHCNMKINKS